MGKFHFTAAVWYCPAPATSSIRVAVFPPHVGIFPGKFARYSLLPLCGLTTQINVGEQRLPARYQMQRDGLPSLINRVRRRATGRGAALVEAAFALPWLFFLFVGAYDWGYFSYAIMATQNAARLACLYTSSASTSAGDSTGACSYALPEFYYLPNMGSQVTACGGTSPLSVVASSVASGADKTPASSVMVTYTLSNMVPIPGLLKSSNTISSVVQMRVK
jgi:Flp pilus assembly protein TadG